MKANRKIAGALLVLVFAAFSGLAAAAGERQIALKAEKHGKGASGSAVVTDKEGGQEEVAITFRGLKAGSVYTAWLVNMKPKMDMAGLGAGDFSFRSDDRGNAVYTATIAAADLSKWQLIEIAYHPSGDPRNMKELEQTALIGVLK